MTPEDNPRDTAQMVEMSSLHAVETWIGPRCPSCDDEWVPAEGDITCPNFWHQARRGFDQLERVVHAAQAVATDPYVEGASWFKPLRDAVETLDA